MGERLAPPRGEPPPGRSGGSGGSGISGGPTGGSGRERPSSRRRDFLSVCVYDATDRKTVPGNWAIRAIRANGQNRAVMADRALGRAAGACLNPYKWYLLSTNVGSTNLVMGFKSARAIS